MVPLTVWLGVEPTPSSPGLSARLTKLAKSMTKLAKFPPFLPTLWHGLMVSAAISDCEKGQDCQNWRPPTKVIYAAINACEKAQECQPKPGVSRRQKPKLRKVVD